MGAERPTAETSRPELIPHRWTRIDDPDSVAIVAAHETVIAGGGPAGLTAAYELSQARQVVRRSRIRPALGRRNQPDRPV